MAFGWISEDATWVRTTLVPAHADKSAAAAIAESVCFIGLTGSRCRKRAHARAGPIMRMTTSYHDLPPQARSEVNGVFIKADPAGGKRTPVAPPRDLGSERDQASAEEDHVEEIDQAQGKCPSRPCKVGLADRDHPTGKTEVKCPSETQGPQKPLSVVKGF